MKEQDIQRRIIKALERRGAYVVKIIQANRAGIPDVLVAMPEFGGQLWGVEVKRPGQKPSALQVYNLEKINSAGGVGIVATSWEEVEAEINRRCS